MGCSAKLQRKQRAWNIYQSDPLTLFSPLDICRQFCKLQKKVFRYSVTEVFFLLFEKGTLTFPKQNVFTKLILIILLDMDKDFFWNAQLLPFPDILMFVVFQMRCNQFPLFQDNCCMSTSKYPHIENSNCFVRSVVVLNLKYLVLLDIWFFVRGFQVPI